MAGFKIDSFRGIRPRISARKLPQGESQTAVNSKLGSNDLEPWDGPNVDTVLAGSNIQTIYLFDNSGAPVWFEFANDNVSVARGALKDDALERTYYTGDGFPKMTFVTIAATAAAPYPNGFRRLGLPPPVAAPNVVPPVLAASTVGNSDTITDGMTSDHFFLTILNSVFDTTTVFTPPFDQRVYVKSDSADTSIGNPIDVGIEVGDTYTVTVIDANTFSISNTSSEHLSKSPIPTSARDGSTADTTLFIADNLGSAANFAGFVHAPNGLEITKAAHGLNNNSEILVTSIGVPVRYRYNSPNTHDPAGGTAVAYNYFTIDYPNTGPYPTGPDNTELTTHECTYDTAGDYFDLFGSWTYEVLSDGDGSGLILEERAFLYTYVTALGEEGPPSPASAFVSTIDGTLVTLDTFSVAPVADYDITNIRLYRTNSTATDADFQFIAEILDTDITYADTILNADLGELLPSTDWDRPDPAMQGIISMPNGMMMGFKDKTVYFCEPYFPHAWPAIYDQAVDFDIVGLASIGNSAVIMTTGTPYIVSGAHPRNASIRPYKINQACSSARSIVSTSDRVMYASPDGLIQIGIDGAANVSEKYFTKKEWQSFSPNSMIASVHDGRYFAFYGPSGHIVFSPDDQSIGFTTGDTTADGIYLNIEDDALYYTDGATVFEWDANSLAPLSIQWRSGVYLMRSPVNLSAGVVQAETYPVTFLLYGDGVLRSTVVVADNEPFRLPGGYLASRYEIEITGTNIVNEVKVAENIFELSAG